MADDKASYQPSRRLVLSWFAQFSFTGRIPCPVKFQRIIYLGSPPYTVTSFKISNPLEILNAAWRYQTSNLFLAMSVNLALLAPSWRWLSPKYCSTMYRTFDIGLCKLFTSHFITFLWLYPNLSKAITYYKRITIEYSGDFVCTGYPGNLYSHLLKSSTVPRRSHPQPRPPAM